MKSALTSPPQPSRTQHKRSLGRAAQQAVAADEGLAAWQVERCRRPADPVVTTAGALATLSPRAREYIAAAVAGHPKIADKFFTGFGLTLQKLDSGMAEELLRQFVTAGKPVLVMHDSFIVKTEDKAMLLAAMKRVHRMATKDRFDAKIN